MEQERVMTRTQAILYLLNFLMVPRTDQEIIEALKIHERTFYRYVHELIQGGYNVYTWQDAKGYFYSLLPRGYRIIQIQFYSNGQCIAMIEKSGDKQLEFMFDFTKVAPLASVIPGLKIGKKKKLNFGV